jgi:hypothetical protein
VPEVSLQQPFHDEDYFFSEDHVAFSPATQETLSLENIMLALIILKLSKTPEGMKSLERIAIKYLDSCARIVESVENACHSNWLTALNNQHIATAISHRIGLIDDGGYIKIMEHYRAVFDKLLISDVALGTLTGIATLVQGSSLQSSATGAETATGLASVGELAVILKGLLKT